MKRNREKGKERYRDEFNEHRSPCSDNIGIWTFPLQIIK